MTSLRQDQDKTAEMWKFCLIILGTLQRHLNSSPWSSQKAGNRMDYSIINSLTFIPTPTTQWYNQHYYLLLSERPLLFCLVLQLRNSREISLAITILLPKPEINLKRDHYAQSWPGWITIHCSNFSVYTQTSLCWGRGCEERDTQDDRKNKRESENPRP